MKQILIHSQGPWEKHKYVKVLDGKYYYPDSYEGGRHLPDGSAAKAGATGANVGKQTVKKKVSAPTSTTKKTSSTSKTASEAGVVTRGGPLGLFKKSDLRKKSGKSLSELEKLLKETRAENERDKKAAEERLKKALAKSSSKSTKTETETKAEDIKKVEEIVKKLDEKKKDNSPDLEKVYSVYKKKRR